MLYKKAELVTVSLKFKDICLSAIEAMGIIGKFWKNWVGIGLFVYVLVRTATMLPYVGIFIYVSLPALFGAQLIAMYRDAGDGLAPQLRDLFAFLRLPATRILLLLLLSLLAFLAQSLLLLRAGAYPIGNTTFLSPHLGVLDYIQARIATHLLLTIALFLPALIVLTNYPLRDVVRLSLFALQGNLPLLLFLFAINVCVDLVIAGTYSAMARSSEWVTMPVMLLFTLWMPAFRYVIACRVIGSHLHLSHHRT